MASLTAARRIVVKIGSALLVDRGSGALRGDWLKSLAEDVAWLKSLGKDVILVSSGSIEFKIALRYREEGASVTMLRVAMSLENIVIGSISPQRVEETGFLGRPQCEIAGRCDAPWARQRLASAPDRLGKLPHSDTAECGPGKKEWSR